MKKNTSTNTTTYAFIDRDGVLLFEPQTDYQIDSMEKFRILPGVIEGLLTLQRSGFELVMVTNQDGLGTASFPKKRFDEVQSALMQVLTKAGVNFSAVFICPHFAKDSCVCRKPKTALLKKLLREKPLNPTRSIVVGDRDSDMQLANNLGIRGVKVTTNTRFPRIAAVRRTTKETDVFVECNLDGSGKYSVQTGLGFYDHMLEQLAKHSLVDLVIDAKGDLHIDEHHTVEDVAITLAQTVGRALNERRGITRYGFTLPMDDTLVEVAIDLGGRPYAVWNAQFKREKVGDLPTELMEHFFRSFADELRANIHVNVRYSKNEHHQIEAIFKAFAKCLRMAVSIDDRAVDQLPTTKGVL